MYGKDVQKTVFGLRRDGFLRKKDCGWDLPGRECEALRELMKPEINKAISDAVAGKDAEIQALKKQLVALNT